MIITFVKVDVALAVGLRSVTWSSLNIEAFFHKISTTLQEFKTFNKQVIVASNMIAKSYFNFLKVQDLYECRILAFLNTMATTLLLDLPSTNTWTIDSFLSHSQVYYSGPYIYSRLLT